MKTIISITILLALTLASCKKFVQVDPPKNNITTNVVFADSLGATTAVMGIYVKMIDGLANIYAGGIPVYTGLAADELDLTTGSSVENEYYTNAISPSNGVNDFGFFSNAYPIIYQTNACIEGLSKSTTLTTSLKNQLTGESKLARAFLYFHLVNLYGAIPLVTSTDYVSNAILPRASTATVYNQITMDLLEAQSLLSANYITAGRVRPTKMVATALLARVYLYQKQWDNAINASSQLINSTQFLLESNLNNVFLSSSKEAIWQLYPVVASTAAPDGLLFLPADATTIPDYPISNYLLSAFETGDKRKINWINSNTIGGTSYYYPFKYKLGIDQSTTPKEYYMVLRLAEQYLIRAEARVMQSDLSGGQADLNMIRTRAGLPNTTATTQAALLTSILHERQTELFTEWGHRWYDLKRTGTVNAVMSVVTPQKGGSWKPEWQLFPIPTSQLQTNQFLVQNPGY